VGALDYDNDDPERNQAPYLDYGPPTTRVVVSALSKPEARIFDVAKPPSQSIGPLLTHKSGIRTAYFHLSGTRVQTVNNDQTTQIFDAVTGEAIGPPLRGPGNYPFVCLSPDGKRVVVWSNVETTASVQETETGQAIGPPLRHHSYVNSVAFSPDAKRIIVGCRENTAQLWDAVSVSPIGSPLRHSGYIQGACFSADSRLVVTASADKTARVWDAATALPIGPPMQHVHRVYCAAFNLKCTRVVTGSTAGTAHLWESVRGQSVGPPLDHGHDGEIIWKVDFSSDGAKIVTTSDRFARIWDVVTGRDITDLFHEIRPSQ
jgi:WD40 repeat protein